MSMRVDNCKPGMRIRILCMFHKGMLILHTRNRLGLTKTGVILFCQYHMLSRSALGD